MEADLKTGVKLATGVSSKTHNIAAGLRGKTKWGD